ncbi:hypothetical protein D6D21_04435 [Aureobasidium pullulans]|uniref:Rhodopsin domain-containing protein n=1 Tax=Aureobasidium pullulans TaxID=5580 RepID=A0AB74J0N9_AURPU|nr:hypothetical protein D6D21_04435 [Aureobasidium pullulans]
MEAISDAAHRVAALGPRTVIMLIVATVFLILTWISFALRVYVRAIMIRSFGKDDWTMLLTLSFAFIAVFQCGVPTHFLIKEAAGECIPDKILQPLNYVHASLNAASDWTFACLPVFVLWNSKIPRSAKISSGLLLSLGAVGSISSLIRIAYIPGLKNGPVFFSNAINIGVWSCIEPGLGIVAASLATLRPLFKSMVDKARNTTNSSRSSKTLDHSRNSNISLQRKVPYSGIRFSERGYLQMDDKPPRQMGNFTSVVGDMKSPPPGQAYELDPIRERQNSTESSRSNSTSRGLEDEVLPPAPVTIGSLQNKSWFLDDEVLMTRHVNIYDEEAADVASPPHRQV